MSFRRTVVFLFGNVSGESPSFRAKPVRNLQIDVAMSPYKEQFKDYWATPVPWADREYGAKPKFGDPVPLRSAAGTLVIGRNRHIDPALVEAGEDNDYKVLMMFRESRGRFTKDQFILPHAPVHAADRNVDNWDPVLRRRGMRRDQFPEDFNERMCAFRSLLVEFNLLTLPPNGGGIAEVQGPPGPKKWHMMVMQEPRALRDLVDALELPLTPCFSSLTPFRRIQTPTSESFRFDSLSYLLPIERIPDVRYTISTVGEQLVWVSPREAMNRFNDGQMEMPTPALMLLSELAATAPTFGDVKALHQEGSHRTPEVILPELVRHPKTNMATVLMPGDLHHSTTDAETRKNDPFLHRFHYEKDWPHGTRAVYLHRPAEDGDDTSLPEAAKPALLEELNEMDRIYQNVPYPGALTDRSEEGSAKAIAKEEGDDDDASSISGVPGLKTTVPIPSHQLRDGPLNARGVVELPNSPRRALAASQIKAEREQLQRQEADAQNQLAPQRGTPGSRHRIGSGLSGGPRSQNMEEFNRYRHSDEEVVPSSWHQAPLAGANGDNVEGDFLGMDDNKPFHLPSRPPRSGSRGPGSRSTPPSEGGSNGDDSK